LELLNSVLSPLEHIMKCVERAWPCLLVGDSGCGKTSAVRVLANVTGVTLHEFAMTSGADSTELLGCFEQVDLSHHKQTLLTRVQQLTAYAANNLLVTRYIIDRFIYFRLALT
jgi:midasin